MNEFQLYLAIGLPMIVALAGIGVNVGYFVSINGRMTRIEDWLHNIMGAIHELDKRVSHIEVKLGIQT